MVVRISITARTTRRSWRSAESSSGSKSSMRDQSAGVRVGRHLRLHPDQALDHVDRGHAFAPEQELALQDGAVELPPRERPRRQASGCQIAVSWPNAMR